MLNSPAVIFLCTYWWLGLKRRVWPHMATRPVCFCRATTFSPSASTSHSGISTCTCLPASRQAMVWLACICVGVHKMTASTSLMARLSARSVVTCLMPYLSATSWVLARSRLMRETTSTPSMFLIPSRCLMPKAPAPASATLMVLLISVVFQNQMSHRRVAGRHMVKTVLDPHRVCAGCFQICSIVGHIGHRATGDQPHHKLNAFATGLAHIVDVRRGGAGGRVGNHLVQPGVIPRTVDQPGACALQLVAHAARAPNEIG